MSLISRTLWNCSILALLWLSSAFVLAQPTTPTTVPVLRSSLPAGMVFVRGSTSSPTKSTTPFRQPPQRPSQRPVPRIRPTPKAMHQVGHFLLDRTEVTVASYQACEKAGGCSRADRTGPYCNASKPGRHHHPINCVSWHQAQEYCRWQGKRLPSMTEWLWAASGPEQRIYPWGNTPPHCGLAVFRGSSFRAGCDRDGTWPVDSLPAGQTPDGIVHLAGNVSEWVNHCAHRTSQGCDRRMVMGGSWQSFAAFVTSHHSFHAPANSNGPLIGFRCAADVPSERLIALIAPPHRPVSPRPTEIPRPLAPSPTAAEREHPHAATPHSTRPEVPLSPLSPATEVPLRSHTSSRVFPRRYLLSIPRVWIAPCDERCRNWDPIGGLPQLKLIEHQRRFQRLTQRMVNQYCWSQQTGPWLCQSVGAKALPVLAVLRGVGAILSLYEAIHQVGQISGAYRPDPMLEIRARQQVLVFAKQNNTFVPRWTRSQSIRLAPGDILSIALYDRDPVLRKTVIARFSVVFQPPTEALQARAFRYIHNAAPLAKRITLHFRPTGD